MKDIKIPFTSYDIFGYILPGALFLLGILEIFPSERKIFIDDVKICIVGPTEYNAFLIASFALLSVAALYFVGHAIACVGHLFYDRLVVRYLLGYPFYLLLGWNIKSVKKARYGTLFFVFFGAFFLMLPVAFLFLKNICAVKRFISDYRILFVIGMFFVIAEVLVYFFVKEKGKKNVDENSLQKTDLCDKIVYMFRKSTATDKVINEKLKKYFNDNLRKKTELQPADFEVYNSDIYWIANIEVSKNPIHSAKLGSWLDMIGCLRNYSCAFLFLAIIESFCLWESVIHNPQVLPLKAILLTMGFTILSILLFSRYWVMYYAYYSKYIIRVYALDDNPKASKISSEGAILSAWNFKDGKDEEKEPQPKKD